MLTYGRSQHNIVIILQLKVNKLRENNTLTAVVPCVSTVTGPGRWYTHPHSTGEEMEAKEG